MVIGLTNKEKKELKNVFDLFDTDHDGKITVKEISKVVHQLSLYYFHTFARFLSHIFVTICGNEQ